MVSLRKTFLTAVAFTFAVANLSAPSANAQGACCDQNACCDTACCDSGCDSHSCLGSGCFDRLADTFSCCDCIQPSDRCFDDFISPMINFVHFEDPRTLTELRPIFLTHKVPATIGNGVPAGGSIQLFALQFRLALSERLSLIAVKDGYILDNTKGALNGLLDSGWADFTAGLKYNLCRDTCRGRLASVGFTYEIPLGSDQALQSVGDGEFHIFATGGQRFCDGNAHFLSAVGYRFPIDDNLQTSSVHWSNHFDVRLTDSLYVFTEAAWWHWTDDANLGTVPGVAGQDLFNLSAVSYTHLRAHET